jgi:hypothetical protein
MQSYDPSVSDLATPMPMSMSPPTTGQNEDKRAVPTGLIREAPQPEKNLDESQMAEFSSSIEEVMPGPGQMMQDEVQGSPYEQAPPQKQSKSKGSAGSSKNPFGLTDEQWYAALAGVAAVIAYSKPVQGKLSTMVPKFLGENGEISMTGMAVTALIAAVIFYFARQFLSDRV